MYLLAWQISFFYVRRSMDSEKARTGYILNRREAESRVIAGVEYRLFRCVAVVVCCCSCRLLIRRCYCCCRLLLVGASPRW